MQIPVVTRVYATACVLTTLAVVRSISRLYLLSVTFIVGLLFQQLGFVTPLQLLYHPQLILQGEVKATHVSKVY